MDLRRESPTALGILSMTHANKDYWRLLAMGTQARPMRRKSCCAWSPALKEDLMLRRGWPQISAFKGVKFVCRPARPCPHCAGSRIMSDKGKGQAVDHRAVGPEEKPLLEWTLDDISRMLKENPKHPNLQWETHQRIRAHCEKVLKQTHHIRERRKNMEALLKDTQLRLKANELVLNRMNETLRDVQRTIYLAYSPKARFLATDIKYAFTERTRASKDPIQTRYERCALDMLGLWKDAGDPVTFWEHMKDILPPDFEEHLPGAKEARREAEEDEMWMLPSERDAAEAHRQRLEHNVLNMPDL